MSVTLTDDEWVRVQEALREYETHARRCKVAHKKMCATLTEMMEVCVGWESQHNRIADTLTFCKLSQRGVIETY